MGFEEKSREPKGAFAITRGRPLEIQSVFSKVIFFTASYALNHEQKMFQMEQKTCKGTENANREQKMINMKFIKVLSSVVHMVFYCRVWSCVTLYGLV